MISVTWRYFIISADHLLIWREKINKHLIERMCYYWMCEEWVKERERNQPKKKEENIRTEFDVGTSLRKPASWLFSFANNWTTKRIDSFYRSVFIIVVQLFERLSKYWCKNVLFCKDMCIESKTSSTYRHNLTSYETLSIVFVWIIAKKKTYLDSAWFFLGQWNSVTEPY